MVAKKTTAKQTAEKKTASTKKPITAKKATTKPVAKKATPKKAPAKKPVAKKPISKKAPPAKKPEEKPPVLTDYRPIIDDPKERKNKGGRPPMEITDEILKRAEHLASCGLTHEEIAEALGMGSRTFYEKKAKFPQFLQAVTIGKARGAARISNKIFELAVAGDKDMLKHFSKCRMGWREGVDLTHSGSVEVHLDSDVTACL